MYEDNTYRILELIDGIVIGKKQELYGYSYKYK